MGHEASSPIGLDSMQNSDLSPADISIPISLRPVLPFLEEAQRNLCNARSISANLTLAISRKKIAIACINHTFRLIGVLNLDWDDEGRACLNIFKNIRDSLSSELEVAVDPSVMMFKKYDDNKSALPSYEIIVAEADEVLALADMQLKEGFRFDAHLNYHTACVYYRVMECLVPALTSQVHQRLQYAAYKTRQCSSLTHNFVREHFEGESCSGIYEVHGSNKLGKGSYGSVYLATHRLTGDERAVKVMNVDRVTSYYLRKLHTEISILKCVDHPNIVKLQDVFFGKRSVYLVTDLCRGGELFELLNAGKNEGFVFREDRASQLMRDMLSAVHYLHSKGILHRDLKLENFLFEEKNCNSPLVLIDFGLSKHFDPEDKLTHRVGSCYYTAPEVLTGPYDFRCDTWSLGVLCYMLLSGSPPFNGKTVEAVYDATLTQDPSFPDRKFRFLSPVCLDFMKRLLVKDPTHRMTTTQALRHPFITGQVSPPPSMSNANVHSTTPASWGMRNIITLSQKISGKCTPKGDKPDTPTDTTPCSDSGKSTDIVPKSNKPVLTSEAAVKIIDSIICYLQADPLTRLTLEMIAHTLSADQLQQFRIEFQSMDRGNQGVVTFKEIEEAIENATSQLPSDPRGGLDICYMVSMICVEHRRKEASGLLCESFYSCNNGRLNTKGVETPEEHREGVITFREYVAATMMKRVTVAEERVTMAFDCLDIEKKGFLTGATVHLALGNDLLQATAEIMLSEASVVGGSYGGSSSPNHIVAAAAAAAAAAGRGKKEKEKEKEINVQMPLQSFLYNWKQNMNITSTAHRHTSLRDIDITLSPASRSGSTTPIYLLTPRDLGSRRDSQTTCESMSQQPSSFSSRRNSGLSVSLRSRRNSDCEAMKRDPMFPDVLTATPSTQIDLGTPKNGSSKPSSDSHSMRDDFRRSKSKVDLELSNAPINK